MKRAWLIPLAALCLSLAGCDLMPVEETYRASPIIRDYPAVEYTLAACTRGDMTLSRSISCTYVPVRTAGLSFQTGGLYYDTAFVSPGDAVEEGQLLFQLKLDDIETQIAQAEREIGTLLTRREHASQDRALALTRAELTSAGLTEPSRREAIDQVNARFDDLIQGIDDQLEIARLRLETYQTRLSERQLRAPFSGTVTYVRRFKEGDTTNVGERIITVADSTMSLFRAETDLWDRFTPGDSVIITASRTDYEAYVVDPAEIGLPPQERTPGVAAYVYFVLAEPTFELEDNTRGKLTLVLDTRRDVLRVPDGAVATINGQSVVYYQAEDGMKAFKNVVTGLEAENMVEIIDGLEEGDIVIAG